MTIRNVQDMRRFTAGFKRGIQGAAKTAMVRGIGKSLPKLRGTAPVDTGAYRRGIDRTPVLVLNGVVVGRIVFTAEHSIWVHRFGYHEGQGKDPGKTGLKKILDETREEIGKEFIRQVSKAAVKGVVSSAGK